MPVSTENSVCEICQANNWTNIYNGPVREGAFGTKTAPTSVNACDGCGVWRLAEEVSFTNETYASDEYRKAMGQGIKVEDFFTSHDQTSLMNLVGIGDLSLRNKRIADIGAGAGSFLDYVAGPADEIIAIEPTPLYHESLKSRGYKLYPFTTDALENHKNQVDLVTSFQVIEHVPDPRVFLEEAATLLTDTGRIVIATPNRNDILMQLLPEDFPSFYFRSAHRWYFDKKSLVRCGANAGLEVETVKFAHGFGLSNTLSWLKDRRPKGNKKLSGIYPEADKLWQAYLESSEQADTIFVTFRKASS